MSEVILTEEQLEQIVVKAAETGADHGVKVAFEWYEDQKEKEIKELLDERRSNTKLLLRKYRVFKAYVDNAVYDTDSEEESLKEIHQLMLGKVTVDGIKNSVARTAVIFAHVERMLRVYRSYCETCNDVSELRRWRVIEGLYIADDKKSAEEIAKAEGVVIRVIYKDVDAACDILGPLFFGFDVLKKR